MIYLVTGRPRHGKTLWTVSTVDKKAKAEGRPVYYWRIEDVTLDDWHEIERIEDVHNLPHGALIVVDEAHRVYPSRTGFGNPPAHIQDYDEHGHRGHDFYIITQRPQELDKFIRGRAEQHFHFVRVFGMLKADWYTWDEYTDTEKSGALNKARKVRWSYPKEYFGTYKSAELEVTKAAIPWRQVRTFAFGIITVFAGGFAVYWFLLRGPVDDQPEKVYQSADPAAVDTPAGFRRVSIEEASQWAAKFEERIAGAPHSIPFYDQRLEPGNVPKIDGCMLIETAEFSRCQCNTQQGTIISTMSDEDCRYYLANGWFDPTAPDEDRSSGSALASSAGPFGDAGAVGRLTERGADQAGSQL